VPAWSDLACGVGYGTQLLAQKGHYAYGFDKDREALAYARQNYAHPGVLPRGRRRKAMAARRIRSRGVLRDDRAHQGSGADAARALRGRSAAARERAERVGFPVEELRFHHRHYTKAEFQESLLERTGWKVTRVVGPGGPESEVEVGCEGRTLLAVAERASAARRRRSRSTAGSSAESALRAGKGRAEARLHRRPRPIERAVRGDLQGPRRAPEVLRRDVGHQRLRRRHRCDRIFHMDDVRVQEIRAAAAPGIEHRRHARVAETHPGPIVTSRTHPDYPGLVPFPLEDVVNECPNGYFNSTAAYAVAYAIWLGVEKVSLFGCDFTYPDAHDAEKGRACVEFWLGVASERGIKIVVPKTTSLLDALHSQNERFYGYDCVAPKRSNTPTTIPGTRMRWPSPGTSSLPRSSRSTAHPR
jgi:SAM-dependent methyltransferase